MASRRRGRGGGGAGGQFVLKFSIQGGEADVARITAGLRSIAAGAAEVGAAGAAASSSFGRVHRAMGNAGAATNTAVSAAHDYVFVLGHLGSMLRDIGKISMGIITGLPKMILHELDPIEQSIVRIKTIGDLTQQQALDTVNLAQQVVDFTPFREAQVVKLTEALVTGKASLDPFTDSLGRALTVSQAVNEGWARLDQTTTDFAGNMKVTGLSLLADFAAMTGNIGPQMDTFVFGVRRALATKTTRLLKDQVAPEFLQAVFGATGGEFKLSTEEVLSNLFEFLKGKGAIGAAAASAATVSGIMSNFADMPLKIARAIGGMPGTGGFFDKLRDGLARLFIQINNRLLNEEWQEKIRKGFSGIMDTFIRFLRVGERVVGFILDFVAENPRLVNLVNHLLLVGGAFITVTGVVVGLVGAWKSLMFFMAMLGPWNKLVLAVSALTSGLSVLAVQSEGLKNNFSGVMVFFKAMEEAWHNWAGATTEISEETARALDERGMLGGFLRLMQVLRFFELAWESLKTAVVNSPWLMAIKFIWDELGLAVSNLVDTISVMFTRLGILPEIDTDVSNITATSERWYGVVVQIVNLFLSMVFLVIGIVTVIVKAVNWTLSWIAKIDVLNERLNIMNEYIYAAGRAVYEYLIDPFVQFIGILTDALDVLKSIGNFDLKGAGAGMMRMWGRVPEMFDTHSDKRDEKLQKGLGEVNERMGVAMDDYFRAKLGKGGHVIDELLGVAPDRLPPPRSDVGGLSLQSGQGISDQVATDLQQNIARAMQVWGGSGSVNVVNPVQVILDGEKIAEHMTKKKQDRPSFGPRGRSFEDLDQSGDNPFIFGS